MQAQIIHHIMHADTMKHDSVDSLCIGVYACGRSVHRYLTA